MDGGTAEKQRQLAVCPISRGLSSQVEFIRRWRIHAIQNYLGFTLSYEVEYLLSLENAAQIAHGEPAPA